MNLSFSTRGWGDLSWDGMLQEAVDMRFGGVEVYNLFKFPELTDRGGPFHAHKVAATIRQLRDLKLKVPCFDTSVDLSSDPEAVTILTTVLENAGNAYDLHKRVMDQGYLCPIVFKTYTVYTTRGAVQDLAPAIDWVIN